jgi:phage protein D
VSGNLYWRLSVNSSGVAYDASDDISSLNIDQQEGMSDCLTAELADPFKVLSHAIQEGMDIEVELGTDDDHAVVFRGRIYKVEGAFPTEQTPTIRLKAYDSSKRMGLRERSRVWSDMALSDIVQTIASVYFIDIDVELMGDPKFPGNGLRQHEKTDFEFLTELAKSYGCVMYVSAGDSTDTFHFVAQYTAMTMDPTVTVYYGRSDVTNRLLKFESSADASKIELPRVLSGIDYDTGKATELVTTDLQDAADPDDEFFDENLSALTEAQPDKVSQLASLISSARTAQAALLADLGTSVRAATTTFVTEDQQSAIAQNQFTTSLHGMRAYGSTVGIRQLTAQTNIQIGDVGGRFSGVWFLSRVRHILDEQGYRSEFECRR